jgi:hypothetical protein
MKRILLAILTALGLTLGIAAPAHASYPVYYSGHWANDDLYVDDNTGAYWPVHKSTYRWSAYPSVLDVHYGTSCTTRCIHVYQVSSIYCATCDKYHYIAGLTVTYWVNGIIVGAKITLSNRTPLDKRLHVVMHEMGHAVGLKHPPSGTYSIMALDGNNKTYPTYIDWWNIKKDWYGVP